MYAFVDKQSSARLSVLLLLSGVMFLARTISLMLTPLLIALAAEFHISTAVAGQLATATYITWGLVAPLVGPISDTYGRRPVALLGLSLMALGILGSVLAWNYESLFACRLLTGMGGPWPLRTAWRRSPTTSLRHNAAEPSGGFSGQGGSVLC